MEIRIYEQILQFYLFRNDPTINTYFTVIIIICGISLDKKKYIITRNTFLILKQILLKEHARNLLLCEVVFTLIDAYTFRAII